MANMGLRVNTDQRRYARFEVLDYAMVYPIDEGRVPFSAVVTDVGLGGVQLRTKERIPPGLACELVIGTPDGKQLTLQGEIRNSRPVKNSSLYGSGYRFTPASHEERIAIAEYVHMVFQRQGERLVQE